MDDHTPRAFVAYCRVSTDRQGRSGLGLEAQEKAIRDFIGDRHRLLAPIFVEVETGKRNDRPELAKALAKCRATGATLLVAKLDRLARNARFLLDVVEGSSSGGVVFLDLPTIPAGPVGKFLITQMAAVAELEAGLIGQRTKAALAAAKARGKALGGLRQGQRLPDREAALSGSRAAAEARSVKANQTAHGLARHVEAARAAGASSLHGIAAHLNAQGVPTARGGTWTATAVRRVLARLEGGEMPA